MIDNQVEVSNVLPQALRQPTIVSWNRLEPRPRSPNFDRALRAEIRDALWMLTRQWQFGEFKGDDAGTATFAKVQIETTRITRFAQRDGKAEAYDDTLPLEVCVEREPFIIDLRMRIEMGQHWLHLLKQNGLGNKYRDLYCTRFAIALPPQDVANAIHLSDRETWQWYAAAAGRGIDGGNFYGELRAGGNAADMTAGSLQVDDADKPQVAQAQTDFLAWYARVFNQPASESDSAWVPEKLEYQFACAAPKADGQIVLIADEYHQGDLDWYSFDRHPDPNVRLTDKPGQVINDAVIHTDTFSFIPTPVRFAGMPNVRWWEFEDRRTDLGDIRADTTDIAKLLLAEFGLIYGNDWSVVPYVVPVGSLCQVTGLAVTDVFGQRTLIRPANASQDGTWQRWSMFNNSVHGKPDVVDERLYVPSTVAKLIESAPIEKVTWLRDEMANMVWAVESIIPNERGTGIDGYEAATDLLNLLKQLGASQPPSPEPPREKTDAQIQYVAGTSVPENWIPFIPVHVPGSNRKIQLQRARMLRIVPGLPTTSVAPRGKILQPGAPGDKYFVHEEEVPRAGAIVTRKYQRARWIDGKTVVWLGRRKQTGRGEGSSGLRFDQIEDKKPA